MQRISVLIVTFLLIQSVFGQNQRLLFFSDSLYAQGVELYHAGKYEDAISMFEKSKSIDSEELDSLDLRVTYVKQWLASCHFKIGDLKKAAFYDECGYDLPPIDRRLLTKRDSVYKTITENDGVEVLVQKLKELYQLEYNALGGESRLTLGTRLDLTQLNMVLESKENVNFFLKAKKRMRKILDDCDSLYGDNFRLKKYLLATAIKNIYSFGTIHDIVEGCNELFICLEKNGESESEFALDIWKYLSGAYEITGMVDKYNQTAERILSLMDKLYGKTDKRYISQLITFANVNSSLKKFDIALLYAQTAESLAISKEGKYCDLHLLTLFCQSCVLMNQNKFAEAKKTLKLIVRKADGRSEILSDVTSALILLYSATGKKDKDLIEEAYALRQKIRYIYGRDSDSYLTISMSLMLAHSWTYTENEKAIKIADEEGTLFEKKGLFEPLFCSSIIYLQDNYYVKSRKASSAALQILNKKLDGRYAVKETLNSKVYIDNGLAIISEKLKNANAHDTILYSLSMIKQDLLQSKLLILDHSDSLGTDKFLGHLKEYAIVAMKETQDQVMADSIINKFSKKTKERFGEESQEYKKFSKIIDAAKFEIEYSNLAKNVQFYKNYKPYTPYIDSLYQVAVSEYNQTFELWKKGDLVKENQKASSPKTPYISEVLRKRNFHEAFLQYEKAFDFELTNSPFPLLFSEAIPMAICTDSMGRPDIYMEKMEAWRKKIMEDSHTSIYELSELLAAVWLHSYDTTYESYERNILESVNKDEKLKLQISAVLKVINEFKYGWHERDIFKQAILSSFSRLEHFLNTLESRKDEENILPIYAAVLYAKYMTLYNAYYFYGYSKREDLLDDYKYIYQLLSKYPVLLEYKESHDIICMLCDIAYNKEDYKLVVATDKLRRSIKNNLQLKSLFSEVSYSFGMEFPESELEHLKTRISLAYYFCKDKMTDDEKYEDLIALWNDIRMMQQNGYFLNNELENRIKELSKDVVHALSPDCSDSIKCLAYDFALFSKGYFLRSEQELAKVLKESGNRTIQKQYEDYLQIKRQLDDDNLSDSEWDSLKRECDNIMRDLKYSSKMFDDYTKSLESSWKDVRNALDEGEMAIEYINDGDSYYALILKKEYKAPIIKRMYNIDEDIKTYGDSLYLKYSSLFWPNFERIGNEYTDILEDVKNIYFSPAGTLHKVSMENMFSDRNCDKLMCEKYNLYRVSNTREIIKQKNNLKKIGTPAQKTALYGGMDYHINDVAWAEIAVKNQLIDDKQMYAMRDVPSIERGVALYLKPLPGSKKEVKQIADIFKESNLETYIYTGTSATEDELKRTSGSDITMLHIATHGFYQTQDNIKNPETVTFIRKGDDKEDQVLSRSGLFMTGASSWFNGEKIPENVNDGILTAREISHLNLTNVDMVVLSACETGLGDVTGDGVYGLQRGFKKAGVQSMIISLWKVSDEATQIFMTEFYRNLINKKLTKRQALVNAKSFLRKYDNGRFSNPKYWAAFILLDAID